MSDVIKRIEYCIARHNQTGYSGILKWSELVATLDLIQTQAGRIAEIEAELEQYKGQLAVVLATTPKEPR